MFYYVPTFLKRGVEDYNFAAGFLYQEFFLSVSLRVPSVCRVSGHSDTSACWCAAVSDVCFALRPGWSGSALVITFIGSSHGALT
jgi:hypothetical protein